MIKSQCVLKSTKRPGQYEDVIINELQSYFTELGYDAIPHARFDLAWGSIISDVDLLLIKDNQLILIEVKSSRDNLARAKKQIKEIEDFVDQVYLATDYHPKKWPSRKAGRIVVNEGQVQIVKEPKSLEKIPKIEALMSLRKESLSKLLEKSENEIKKLTKFELASLVMQQNQNNLKSRLKAIVTCQ